MCKMKKAHERSYYRSSQSIGIPCAMVRRLICVLSPVSMTLLVTVASRNVSRGLTPAQGCQDHTPLPYALGTARLATPLASIASRPPIVTTRSPLLPRRDGRIINIDLRKTETEYFWLEGWTNAILFGFTKMICPTGKSGRVLIEAGWPDVRLSA